MHLSLECSGRHITAANHAETISIIFLYLPHIAFFTATSSGIKIFNFFYSYTKFLISMNNNLYAKVSSTFSYFIAFYFLSALLKDPVNYVFLAEVP